MSKEVFLDTGPLGLLSHPRRNKLALAWFYGILNQGTEVVVPEIADYEVRRELIRAKKRKGIERLDNLKKLANYLALSTPAMLKAAELWATARRQGVPTADRHALDADVILAAQALTFQSGGREVVVATDNVAHISRFVSARTWESIS